MKTTLRNRSGFWLAIIALLSVLTIPAVSPAAPPAEGAHYHIIKRVVLGGTGFWDYMGFDNANRRLFISHGTHVMVVDADSFKVVGDIPNTKGVHGIAIAPELNRGFISDGGADQVTIFDLKTLKTIGEVKVTGHNPDCIAYDPASQRVFTFNGRSGNSTAIDAKTGKVVGTIDLGGRPEFAVADGAGMIYNNLEDKSVELAIDTHTLQIKSRWPMAPCEHPSGLAIDSEHRVLFAGCHNQVMGIINADTGKVIATPPIGNGVDANRFDPGTRLAFSSNGDGTLTVVKEVSPTEFKVVQNATTERGARTMEVDPKTHNVFLVTAKFGPPQPQAPGQRFHRPSIIPGSFTLLVLAP
ncbi:MAG: YncE family protein [Terriglobia bacterium]